jgi:hypothetical protein
VDAAAAGAADFHLEKAGIDISRTIEMLKGQPPLPHAAWKRLVQDVQVTLKTACRAGRQREPKARCYRRPGQKGWHLP